MSGYDLSEFESIFIPITVLEELDKHNHSTNPEKSFKARNAIRYINKIDKETPDRLQIVMTPINDWDVPDWLDLNATNDNKIIMYANDVQKDLPGTVFLTFDLNLYHKAMAFGLYCVLAKDKTRDIYKGYHEVMMSEVEYAEFISTLDTLENKFDLLENQYLIIYANDGTILDRYRWTSDGYKYLNTRSFKTPYCDTIKPISDDPTQFCAFDSLYSTDITVLFGKAGTGKTMLSLGYLMSQLHNNKLNKLYIVHSFETLKGAKTLGFLPGNKEEKIFGSGIGTILSTKFGGIDQTIKPLIQSNRLEIVPTAELRGVEFGENDACFITEAQNTDAYAMKTIIQRCKEGCKIVIEGDMLEQTDIRSPVNGMERVIDVFKGSKYFSCVKLQKNNRSPICELADKI